MKIFSILGIIMSIIGILLSFLINSYLTSMIEKMIDYYHNTNNLNDDQFFSKLLIQYADPIRLNVCLVLLISFCFFLFFSIKTYRSS